VRHTGFNEGLIGSAAEWRAGQIRIRGVRVTHTHGAYTLDPNPRVWVRRLWIGYWYTQFYKKHVFHDF